MVNHFFNVILMKMCLRLFQMNSDPIIYLYCQGSQLQHKVQFVWINQEDEAEVRKMDQSYHSLSPYKTKSFV